jgi:hypothetical protein
MEIKLKQKGFSYNVLTSSNKLIGTFELDIDGYYYYCERKDLNGFWDSHILRLIADKLDEVNKPWDESVKEDICNQNYTTE